MGISLAWAVGVSLAVAATAGGLGTLTRSGVAAATLVGTMVLAGTGWSGGLVLAAFFVGGTLVSLVSPDPAARNLDAKTGPRDAAQVLANGWGAAVGGLLAGPWGPAGIPGLGFAIVVASLAAASADTWATGLGGWSRTPPRLIIGWRPVAPGTSGGVTGLGMAGGAIGALLVAGVATLAPVPIRQALLWALVGFAGMLVDSVLGALVQARFHCPACERPTERPLHSCGTRTVRVSGLRWCTNDTVNALATGAAGLAGAALVLLDAV